MSAMNRISPGRQRVAPDALAFTADGRFLYTANLFSNNVSMFSINSGTGALVGLGAIAAGSFPSYVAIQPLTATSPTPAPPTPTVNTPPPNSGTPSPPRGVNVRRNNLALVVDFSPPA